MGANESKGQQPPVQQTLPAEPPERKKPKGTNKPVPTPTIDLPRTPEDEHTESSSYATKMEEGRGAWKKSLKKDIPEPVPQISTKQSFLRGIDFEIVDDHALKAPKDLLMGSFWDLINYLTDDDVWDDMVRVRAIYRWITSYDIQNMDIDVTPPPDTPLEYFSKIQCDMGNLANLFYILCTMAEVPCQVIDGITKNTEYILGETTETTDMKAQWNAVYVQNEWRLLDLFWAKSCTRVNSGEDEEHTFTQASIQRSIQIHEDEADEEYFFTDAYHLIWTHFPDDEKWQLLKTPMKKADFFDTIYVRERTRELGVTYPNTSLAYKVKDGQSEFKLDFPQNKGVHYHFKHNFNRIIPQGDSRRKLDKILHHFIMFERHDDSIHFMFNIPVLGKFRCNIFARDENTEGLDKFDLMCSFLVLSTELAKECLPLPDYPKIGWGPNRISRKYELIPITHEESSIYTDTGKLDIRVKGRQELKLEMKLLNAFVDSANMSKYAMMYWKGGDYIVKTRLPRFGIYGLKYFIRNPDTNEQENVLNYLIHCSMKNENLQGLPNIAQETLGPHRCADDLGVAATVYENGYIEAKEGHAKLELLTKPGVELMSELHCNDLEAVPRMRVHQSKKNNKQSYHIDVPVKGEYAFNLYAFKADEPHKLNNAYAFLINSHGRHIDVGTLNNKTLENSKNFWKSTKEVKAESIVTTDTEISIPVPRGLDSLVAFLQKVDRSEPQSSESINVATEKGIDIYKITLEDLGDYTFNIFQQDHNFLRVVSRYIITRNDHEDDIEEDVKEVLEVIKEERENAGTDVSDLERHMNAPQMKNIVDVDKRIEAAQQLAIALQSNDPQQIRKALSEYQYNKPEGEDDLLKQGRKQLRKLEAKYDLLRAYKERELTNLDRAIAVASAANEDRSFDQQLIHAKRLRDRLAAIRTMQDIVRNTDNRVIGEIRQYNTPPVGVHQTVMAALMLLGHDLSEVKTWKQCQKILGQQVDKSFLNLMSKFDPKDVNLRLAVEAKKSIEPYTAEQIHAESSGAASIFIWVQNMIGAIEYNAGTLGVNKMVPEHTQAMVEIQKPVKAKVKEPEQPKSPRKPKAKAGPTLVTLESLLIESPLPSPSPVNNKKQKQAKGVAKNQTNGKKTPAPDIKDGRKSNPREITKPKDNKTDSKDVNKNKQTETNKNKDKIKNIEKTKSTKQNGVPTHEINNAKSPVEEKPSNKDTLKPKKNFIASNVKKFKPKNEEEESEENVSSYLSNYQKRPVEPTYANNGNDNDSLDGHISLPSYKGIPAHLDRYHGHDINIDNLVRNSNRYVLDFDVPGNKTGDDAAQESPEPGAKSKKCYAAIYSRRKEDKQAIDKLWANSVKAK